FGVDTTETEHRRHHVGALGELGTCRCSHVEIAAGIDDDVAQERLATLFRLADRAFDAAVVYDRLREPGVEPEIDASLRDHVVGDTLPAVGVESRGHDDGQRLRRGPEIMNAPPGPFAPHFLALPPVLGRRVDGRTDPLHPLNHFHADTCYGD